MNTSTNKPQNTTGGALADGLTLVRLILTPIIMLIIIKGGWPSLDMAVLASVLFIIAAFTDIFDDMLGGDARSSNRLLGWADDIADVLLITGTLIALLWALYSSGFLTWVLAVPAGIIIMRNLIMTFLSRRSLRQIGWPETKFGTFELFITTLAVSVLVASPWLSNFFANLFNAQGDISQVYNFPWVGRIGIGLLWFAAVLSVFTAFQFLKSKPKTANNT